MLSVKESNIISRMKTFSLMGVILIHAPKLVESSVTDLFSKSIPSACVPLFFILSGFFLLGKNLELPGIFVAELRKRISTLLFPFLFWNILMLVLATILLSSYPLLTHGGQYTLRNFSPQTIVAAIFGINRSPINYQFWFIRNLMVFVLLAYFFRQFLIRSPWLGLALALFIEQWVTGAGYFYLGGVVAVKANAKIFATINAKSTVFAAIAVFTLSVAISISYPIMVCASFTLIFGLSNIEWGSRAQAILHHLGGSVFFIYAIHEPLITILTRVAVKATHNSQNFYIAEYFLIPVLVLLISWAISTITKKHIPRYYSFVTGSR